ncbi:hypothetical protein [Methylomonas koyamae]|uniref:hypothetical protein n=1 Tax=Methylomonas koyamae TaxID=702114 RepID=UPI000A95D432|nr:hypothetical protein [Methylomonas koyamae]
MPPTSRYTGRWPGLDWGSELVLRERGNGSEVGNWPTPTASRSAVWPRHSGRRPAASSRSEWRRCWGGIKKPGDKAKLRTESWELVLPEIVYVADGA